MIFSVEIHLHGGKVLLGAKGFGTPDPNTLLRLTLTLNTFSSVTCHSDWDCMDTCALLSLFY